MKRKLLLAVAVVALLAMAATSASALSKPKLSFVKSNATIGWTTAQGSSPADPGNGASLRYNVATGGGVSAYTYGASETLLDLRGRALSAIDHLGFDSRGYLGAGAPRISLGTVDAVDGNHTYFLSALYCNDPIGTSGWRTSDFVGDTTDCTIFRDGVQMTWAEAVVIADAAGETVVASPNDWFLIVDESPAVGNIDRLSVQEWMWNRGGNPGIVNCNVGNCV
jgi:hypothetical protein